MDQYFKHIMSTVQDYATNETDFSKLEDIMSVVAPEQQAGLAKLLQRQLIDYTIPDEKNRIRDAILTLEQYKTVDRSPQVKRQLTTIKQIQYQYCVELIKRFQAYCLEKYRKNNVQPTYRNGDLIPETDILLETIGCKKFRVVLDTIKERATEDSRRHFKTLRAIL